MDDLKYVFFLFWRIIPNEWRDFKALGDLKVGTSAPPVDFYDCEIIEHQVIKLHYPAF